jgi:hypothetical protein
MDKFPKYLQTVKNIEFFNTILKKIVILAVTGFIALLPPLYGCSRRGQVKQSSKPTIMSTSRQGDKMVSAPEKTQGQYSCAAAKRVVFRIEDVQILPAVVSSGQEINHRIRYALCPFPRGEIVEGDIVRVVRLNEQELFHDVDVYQFKPGTWVVDAFIGIPREAQGGTYTIETIMKYKQISINNKKSFTVREK